MERSGRNCLRARVQFEACFAGYNRVTGPHQSFRQHSSQEARAPPRLPRVVCVFTIQLGPRCLVHPGQLITVVGIRGRCWPTVADHCVWLGFRPNYGNTAVMRCGGRWYREAPGASFLVLIKRTTPSKISPALVTLRSIPGLYSARPPPGYRTWETAEEKSADSRRESRFRVVGLVLSWIFCFADFLGSTILREISCWNFTFPVRIVASSNK